MRLGTGGAGRPRHRLPRGHGRDDGARRRGTAARGARPGARTPSRSRCRRGGSSPRCRPRSPPCASAGGGSRSCRTPTPTCSTRRSPRSGVPIDERVVAGDIGSYKPAFGHWETFFRRTGAERSRHVHVAASLFHDIEPCAKLGLPAVWIDRLGEQSMVPRSATLHRSRRIFRTRSIGSCRRSAAARRCERRPAAPWRPSARVVLDSSHGPRGLAPSARARTCTRCSGCPPTASDDDIRHAYRALARRHHPDVDPDDVAGVGTRADGFRRVAAAYEVLGNGRDRGPRTTGRSRSSAWRPSARRAGTGRVPRRPTADRLGGLPRPSGVDEPGRPRPTGRDEPPTGPRAPVDEWRLVVDARPHRGRRGGAIVIAVVVLMVVSAERAGVGPPPPPTIWCKTPDGWHDCWQATSPGRP